MYMTCIVNFETKKSLIQAVSNNEEFFIEDPSFMNPRSFTSTELRDGEKIVVTNHPKRSWFAQLQRSNGILKVK